MNVSALLTWFSENKRELPWRKNYEPYKVWVSEVMLQQTQVATMLPYFENFMRRFPTVEALAAAPVDDVLKAWAGLGYYRRAHHLHKAAQWLVANRGGQLPSKKAELLLMPGVGDYTASAVSSIAFEEDEVLLDGNVMRVLSRFLALEKDPRKHKEELRAYLQRFLPVGQARDFNQALMELGALVCSPSKPKCSACPLQKDCQAHLSGVEEAYPILEPKAASTSITVAVGLIFDEAGQVFIQKRASEGLMAGLWEFPGGKVETGETPERALHREIQEELGVSVRDVRPFHRLKHAYTRFKVDLHAFTAQMGSGTISLTAASEGKFVAVAELAQYAFPSANQRILDKLLSSTLHL